MVPWNQFPELPSAGELMAPTEAPLSDIVHNVEEPPGNKDTYLDNQYRMLRYDGVELLRRSVQTFRENVMMVETAETAVYTKVAVTGYTATKMGVGCQVRFSTERATKRIRWTHSDRLKCGSVVAISTDNFKTSCAVAVVAARRLNGGLMPSDEESPSTPPRIDIFWANAQDAIIDPTVQLIMVQAKCGYFEGVRHTLLGLQAQFGKSSRFDNYIIDGDQSVHSPGFIEARDGMIDFAPMIQRSQPVDEVDGEGSETSDDGDSSAKNPQPCLVSLKEKLPDDLQELTGLDSSQLEAIAAMLSQELSVVQGPPGTGKTYTSVALMNLLLSNAVTKKPIILASQTNHALDQLLMALYNATGVNFVRLGSRSVDDEVKQHTLFHLRKTVSTGMGDLGAIERDLKAFTKDLSACIRDTFPCDLIDARELLDEGIITQGQLDSLLEQVTDSYGQATKNPLEVWLMDAKEEFRYVMPDDVDWDEFEDEQDLAVEDGFAPVTAEDDEREQLHGTFIPILLKWVGRVDPRFASNEKLWRRCEMKLKRYQDLYRVGDVERGAMYQLFYWKLLEVKTQRFRELLRQGERLAQHAATTRARADRNVIKELGISVVGCTTTGLTKFHRLIKNLGPEIMLIEEAAESREANIVAGIYDSLQQLILVGDHQQLVPHTDVQKLAYHPFNMRVSLFERLVNMGVNTSVLSVQRRMIPDIRELLMPFYPTLTDHRLVLDPAERPLVGGMGNVTSWFFAHRWPETVTQRFGRQNRDEAKMLVLFIRYLTRNGTDPSRITVLCYYRSQRSLVSDMLTKDCHIPVHSRQNAGVRVHTVDGYQGEENDVVILSLVRSPRDGADYKVGFVQDKNRAVVALSRARRGLYIFGNWYNLTEASGASRALWGPVLDIIGGQDRCHAYLPITCKRHGEVRRIQQVSDWDGIQGGCHIACDETMRCGHMCPRRCHPDDCNNIRCLEPCRKVLTVCGHRCSERCGEACKCNQSCDAAANRTTATDFESLENFMDHLHIFRVNDPENQQTTPEAGTPSSCVTLVNENEVSAASGTVMEGWRQVDILASDNRLRDEACQRMASLRNSPTKPQVLRTTFQQVEATGNGTRQVVSRETEEQFVPSGVPLPASSPVHMQLAPREPEPALPGVETGFDGEGVDEGLVDNSVAMVHPPLDPDEDLMTFSDID